MKEIKELENEQYRYYITEEGKVYVERKSNGSLKEKFLRLKGGYPTIRIKIKGRDLQCSVHRLVAQAFIPNPQNKSQVNHIDGNRENSHVNNLEWVTPKENVRHAIVNIRSDIKTDRVVIICKIRKEVLEVIDFTADAVKKYGIWVKESLRGNSTYGNLIAVLADEYEAVEDIDSLIKKREPKRLYNTRTKYRKYSETFVEDVKNKWACSKLQFVDFCKDLRIDTRLVRVMLNGSYFKDSKHHQRGRATAMCYYSGISRIDFKNYKRKVKIPKNAINYKNFM